MVFKDVRGMRLSRLKRFMSRAHFDDEMALHKVDCESSHGWLDNYDFLLEKQAEFASEPLIPPPLISGRDLLELGWKPGRFSARRSKRCKPANWKASSRHAKRRSNG